MLKDFQFEDLTRATLRDGVVFSWDTGLGKTWAAYLWPALKVGFTIQKAKGKSQNPNGDASATSGVGHFDFSILNSVLIVAPGDLHLQLTQEGAERFGQTPTVIRDPQHFLTLARPDARGTLRVPPGYYLATYTAMGGNGVPDPWTAERGLQELLLALYPDDWLGRFNAVLSALARLVPLASAARSTQLERSHESLAFLVEDFRDALTVACAGAGLEAPPSEWLVELAHGDHNPTTALAALARHYERLLHHSLGEELKVESGKLNGAANPIQLSTFNSQPDLRVRCVHAPELADLCAHTWDCVVVDEAVRIKGEKTAIAKAIHRLQPRYRLVLTATAIKNRLPDIWRLAWWAAGGRVQAHALWPYADDPDDKERFTEEFMIMERNLTREREARAETGKNRQFRKATAQVCNVHKLWKLLPTLVLRRRKDDCGEQIPPKVRHIIRAPMGQAQKQVYAYHLSAKYTDKNGKPAPGAKLQALRIAASAPHSPLLHVVGEGSESVLARPTSQHPYIPKVATTLELIAGFLDRGEQVLVFGAFHDALDELERRLTEAGVGHLKLDGRTIQAQRGRSAHQFKGQQVPVVLAGNCMSEGHSFPLCPNVIVTSYDWAWDKLEQGINRVHRINSPGPVHVYSVIAEGTADRVLEQLLNEKGDSATLVMDGRLLAEHSEEVNVAELLQEAAADYRRNEGKAVCEEVLLATWPVLRERLRRGAAGWNSKVKRQKEKPDETTTRNPKPKTQDPVPIRVHPCPSVVENPQSETQHPKLEMKFPSDPDSPFNLPPSTPLESVSRFDPAILDIALTPPAPRPEIRNPKSEPRIPLAALIRRLQAGN